MFIQEVHKVKEKEKENYGLKEVKKLYKEQTELEKKMI